MVQILSVIPINKIAILDKYAIVYNYQIKGNESLVYKINYQVYRDVNKPISINNGKDSAQTYQ